MPLPELIPTPTGRYRHYKGGEYVVLYTARHSETLDPLVVYTNGADIWVRPQQMFTDNVAGGTPRFTCLGPVSQESEADLLQSLVLSLEEKLERATDARSHPRYRNPFLYCPQCGGEMHWTSETLLRCHRDLTHVIYVAGPYTLEEQIIENEPPVRFPTTMPQERLQVLASLER